MPKSLDDIFGSGQTVSSTPQPGQKSLDDIFGTSSSTTSQMGSTPQRSLDDIFSGADNTQQTTASTTDATVPPAGGTQPPAESGSFMDQATSAFKNRAADIQQYATGQAQSLNGEAPTLANTLVPGAKTALHAAGQGASYLQDLAKAAMPDWLKERLKSSLDALSQTDLAKHSKNIIDQAATHYNDLKSSNPQSADALESLLNIGATVGVGSSALEGGAGFLKSGAGALEDMGAMGKNALKSTGEAIKKPFTPNTLDKVLSTPEESVYKLNPTERSAWYDNQKSTITGQSDQAKTGFKTEAQQAQEQAATTKNEVKTGLGQVQSATEQQMQDLNKQLATASRDKVIELRPKILSAMGEQSQEYRALVDKEMAGKENIKVDNGDIKDFVDSRFGDNPGQAAAIKAKLGLTEQVNPLSSQTNPLGTSAASNLQPNTTLGKMYEQAKSLRQDISSGATKGNKIFSPDEKLTDEAINTLTSYMKSQGIDLKEANQFWSKYAPIRNQLVTEAKPFLQTGTQTKQFAQTLMRVAKGTDVNNENFINEVENLVGEPINAQNKVIVSKMDATQKASAAADIAAQEKIANADLVAKQAKEDIANRQTAYDTATQQKLKDLSDRKYETERRAIQRSIVKKVLWGTVGLGADKYIKAKTGFGI